ncbi:MAG: shikimate dehydrogenase [Candidatus Marinimicrobia bacterium]|nr:shikimate dehydrogenase [Candidatus Neomarinimicrobiota bacterium]
MTFGLLGHQIAYSLSPIIHNMIAREHIDYRLFDISPDKLDKAVFGILSRLSGFNVTIPYKQRIMQYCQEFDPVAKKIGAVNTIHIKKAAWIGYNTDYLGFMRVIKKNIPDYLSYHPVILGYGGVARAVIFGLETLGFHAVSVYGGKQQQERETFIEAISPLLRMQVLDILPDIPRLWINCTPVGSVKIPDIPEEFIKFRPDDMLYDLNYAPYPTYLEQAANKQDILTINGIQMLIYQAIESQSIWMEKDAATDVDIDTIIHSINQ